MKILHKNTAKMDFLILEDDFILKNSRKYYDAIVDIDINNKSTLVKVGNIYLAKVVNVTDIGAFVDLGNNESALCKINKKIKLPLVGDIIEVQIIKPNVEDKKPLASISKFFKGVFINLYNSGPIIRSTSIFNNYSIDDNQRLLDGLKNICESVFNDQLYSIELSNNICNISIPVDHLLKLIEDELYDFIRILSKISKIKSSLLIKNQIGLLHKNNFILDFIKNNIIYHPKTIATDCSVVYNFLVDYYQNNNFFAKILDFFNTKIINQKDVNILDLDKVESIISLLNNNININGIDIYIDRTRSFTTIDINTGKYNKNTVNYKLDVNKIAFMSIIREVKLRKLSGIILIDFISMPSVDDYKDLYKFINYSIRNENSSLKFIENNKYNLSSSKNMVPYFTSLGIGEFVNKRVSETIEDLLTVNVLDQYKNVYKSLNSDILCMRLMYSIIEKQSLINSNKGKILNKIDITINKHLYQDFISFLSYEKNKGLKNSINDKLISFNISEAITSDNFNLNFINS